MDTLGSPRAARRKPVVWIQHRQHPGEGAASWFCAMSGSTEAQAEEAPLMELEFELTFLFPTCFGPDKVPVSETFFCLA